MAKYFTGETLGTGPNTTHLVAREDGALGSTAVKTTLAAFALWYPTNNAVITTQGAAYRNGELQGEATTVFQGVTWTRPGGIGVHTGRPAAYRRLKGPPPNPSDETTLYPLYPGAADRDYIDERGSLEAVSGQWTYRGQTAGAEPPVQKDLRWLNANETVVYGFSIPAATDDTPDGLYRFPTHELVLLMGTTAPELVTLWEVGEGITFEADALGNLRNVQHQFSSGFTTDPVTGRVQLKITGGLATMALGGGACFEVRYAEGTNYVTPSIYRRTLLAVKGLFLTASPGFHNVQTPVTVDQPVVAGGEPPMQLSWAVRYPDQMPLGFTPQQVTITAAMMIADITPGQNYRDDHQIAVPNRPEGSWQDAVVTLVDRFGRTTSQQVRIFSLGSGVAPPLRLLQRNDGVGLARHVRLLVIPSNPDSRQRAAAPRLPSSPNTYS